MKQKKLIVTLCAAFAVTGACDSTPPASQTETLDRFAQLDEVSEGEEEPESAAVREEPVVALSAPDEPIAGEAGSMADSPANEPATIESIAADSDNGGKKNGVDTKLESALGSLDQAEVQGIGGLGLKGAGAGGGGSMDFKLTPKKSGGPMRIQGMGKVATGSGYGKGSGYGRGAGNLGERRVAVPKVRVGSATVKGHAVKPRMSSRTLPVEPERTSEEYTNHGINKFVDASEDSKSTFAIDVDTGSYTIARRKLNNGALPPKASVRVEEFVNYFSYDYRPPTNGDPFAVYLEAAPTPLAGVSDRYLMRVGVQGKKIRDEDRKPVNLTFLVDVSGSMNSQDKIGLVKGSLEFLTNNLQPTDTIAIATYAGRTQKVLDRTPVSQKAKIIAAIDKLGAGGSTAMSDGLQLAYGLAMKDFDPDHENRVIVLSDGDANVGRRTHSEILDEISSYVKKGVTLSTVGFGMGNYRDTLMEQLANKGNGNYSYIDSAKEAEKVFGQQVDGTLQVIAKDVKIQVEFNPKAVARYRLVGYENRDIADKDFRNDKVDAGEIGAGHTVTAIYEIDLAAPIGDLPDNIATVRVRNKTPRGTKAVERAFSLAKKDVKTKLTQTSKDYQFAAAVVAFAEKLRDSPYAAKISYDLIEEIAAASTRGKSQRKEFVQLVQKARSI